MTEILAVFRSRSQATDCVNRARAQGLPAGLINTPKEANIGCGLSVKVPVNCAGKLRAIVARSGYSAFYGFYRMENKYGRIFVIRIR